MKIWLCRVEDSRSFEVREGRGWWSWKESPALGGAGIFPAFGSALEGLPGGPGRYLPGANGSPRGGRRRPAFGGAVGRPSVRRERGLEGLVPRPAGRKAQAVWRRHLYLCRCRRRGAEPQGGAALRKWRARRAGGASGRGRGDTCARCTRHSRGRSEGERWARRTRRGPSRGSPDALPPPKQKTKRDSEEPRLLETSNPKQWAVGLKGQM